MNHFIFSHFPACRQMKDRRDRKLSFAETQHYQKTIVALSETIRLMAEIDETIPVWPIT